MTAQTRTGSRFVLGVLAGLAGVVVLAALWHLLGGAAPPRQENYEYSGYFLGCLSWPFAAAYFALSIALGWGVRRGWPVALGMVLPLPIAMGIEMASNPTSHNLMPFEVLLYWLPAFGLAFLGAHLGERLATRFAPMEAAPRGGKQP